MNEVYDLAPHLVRLNQLVNHLNREGRNTYNPDVDTIEGIAIEIEQEAMMIRKICAWLMEQQP